MNLKWDRYHAYDFSGEISVPSMDGTSSEPKTFNNLKADLSDIRSLGASKGIVDASVTTVGRSAQGRDLLALKVGNGGANKVLFMGCHHAREWISAELVYLVAEYLVRAYTDSPSNDQEKRIRWILNNREIWFVPIVNPDGHLWSMLVNRQWRSGRGLHDLPAGDFFAPRLGGGAPRHIKYPAGIYEGVDLNRNYPTSTWGQETFRPGSPLPTTSANPRDGGPNSVWCGPNAASEPEVQAIVALMSAQGFRASISYHSFGQLLLYPDAGSTDAFLQFVGKGMNTLIGESGNSYTYESGSALYPTTGDSMEYAWEVAPGRPTFTPEVRPTFADSDRWMFSLLPEDQIEPCFRENLGAALALIQCAGFDAPPTTRVTPALVIGDNTRMVLNVMPNCWRVFSHWTV